MAVRNSEVCEHHSNPCATPGLRHASVATGVRAFQVLFSKDLELPFNLYHMSLALTPFSPAFLSPFSLLPSLSLSLSHASRSLALTCTLVRLPPWNFFKLKMPGKERE